MNTVNTCKCLLTLLMILSWEKEHQNHTQTPNETIYLTIHSLVFQPVLKMTFENQILQIDCRAAELRKVFLIQKIAAPHIITNTAFLLHKDLCFTFKNAIDIFIDCYHLQSSLSMIHWQSSMWGPILVGNSSFTEGKLSSADQVKKREINHLEF